MLSTGKLGFWGLTSLVFGLVVGVGIFNLPQNMAGVAGPAAVLISWGIVALGIFPLVLAFQWLSKHYPQYNAGIYHYAQAGFGSYTGFNVAWGYWLCSAFSNVAYAVMLNDTVGAFFPTLLRHDWWSVLFCSLLVWLMYFIVSRGLQLAKVINTALAGIKALMLVFILVVFLIAFKSHIFTADIWGHTLQDGPGLWEQIKRTMMVGLFCFFGVEGAVMMSSRASRQKDVGRAGMVGFLLAMVLYVCISVLCFGLAERGSLAGMHNPSVAYILRDTLGPWAYWLVVSGLLIALLGGWVAWTLVVAQVPSEAARVGILPKWFAHTNKHGMPDYGLLASSIAMEFFLLLVVFSPDAYLMALRVTGLMIVPGYMFVGLFLWQRSHEWKIRVLAVIIVVFCLWMIYAGGIRDFLLTSLFYLAGTGVYLRARHERGHRGGLRRALGPKERWAFGALLLVALASVLIYILS